MKEPKKPNSFDFKNQSEYKEAYNEYVEERTLYEKYQEQQLIEAKAAKFFFWVKTALIALCGIILLSVILGSFYTVPERHVGIVKRFSEAISQSDPGFHFKIPFIDSIELMEFGIRKYELSMPVATIAKKDGGEAELQLPSTVTVAANWNVPKEHAIEIFRTYGGMAQFDDRVLDQRFIRSTKAHFSKHSIEHIISNRESIRAAIESVLRTDLASKSVILSDFSIKDIQFNQGIKNAILQKQQAKLQAEKEKHTLEQQNLTAQQQVNTANAERDSAKAIADGKAYAVEVEAEAEAKAIRMKGEAEAAAIKAKARALKNNPLIVELTHQQQWNGQYPSTMMGEGSNILWNMQK
jgi:regulator of protease activity HflC (stomatin/prohibitin superfamily)